MSAPPQLPRAGGVVGLAQARVARRSTSSTPTRSHQPAAATATALSDPAVDRRAAAAEQHRRAEAEQAARAQQERARRRANLRPVPTRQRRPAAPRIARVVAGMTAFVLTAIGVFGIVTLNALAAEASFEAKALEADISEATLQHDDLVAAVAHLTAPGRVRDVAITQLGLLEPETPGFLVVDADDMPAPAPKPTVRLGE